MRSPDNLQPTEDEADLLAKVERILHPARRGAGGKEVEPGDLEAGGAFAGLLGQALAEELSAVESPRETLAEGEKLGRFVILGEAGAGGMGVVYAAYDPQLDRKVALKLLRRKGSAEDRLLREARALARLSHPNVLPVHDVLSSGDRLVIAMELVPGQDLRQWQQSEKRSVQETLAAYVQAARGLAAAHRGGIIHRDVKPDNLLMGRDGRVRVTDFGIAHGEETDEGDLSNAESTDSLGERLTRPGLRWGTPAYQAPELREGKGLGTARSDQYALCLALHEALTGSRLERNESPTSLSEAAQGARQRLPSWLRRVLERGLSRDPADRYGTMDDLATALADDPLVRRRRHAGWLRAALGVLLGVALVGGFLTVRERRHSAPLLTEDQRGRILIAPFVNDTGEPDLDWIEHGLQTLLLESLNDIEGIDPVDLESLSGTLISGAALLKTTDVESVRRVTQAFGAELAVFTTVERTPGGLRFVYRTLNVLGTTGERSFLVEEPMAGVEELNARLGRRLRPTAEVQGIIDRFSENPFVNQLYAMGLNAQRTDGWEPALAFFQVVTRLDPGLQDARYRLVECLSRAGRKGDAVALARELTSSAEGAADTRALAEASGTLGLALAGYGQPGEARQQLERSVELWARVGDQAREAKALYRLGNYLLDRWFDSSETPSEAERLLEPAKTSFQKSIELLRSNGSIYDRVRANYYEGAQLSRSGDHELAEALLGENAKLAEEEGFLLYQGLSLNLLAIVVRQQGRPDEAPPLYRQAAAAHRSISNWSGVSMSLSNLGRSLRDGNRTEEAIIAYQDALDAAHRANHAGRIARANFGMGQSLLELENYEAAKAPLEEALGYYGDGPLELYALARAARGLQDWESEVKYLERAKEASGEAWGSDGENELRRALLARERSVPQ